MKEVLSDTILYLLQYTVAYCFLTYLSSFLDPACELGEVLLVEGATKEGEFLRVPDPHLTADLGHRKERHDGKTGPHLVAVLVGHLDSDVAMYGDKLELGIGHDPVGVERLAWLVQPNALIGPPQGKVRPVSITC